MSPVELATAVEEARHGDRVAVESVLREVQDQVHRLALRMTASPDDALDATQEILIKVLTRLSTFNGEAAFTTWVHRVAVNHLLDRRRSAVERLRLTFEAFAEDLHEGLASSSPDAAPEADLLAREVKQSCTLAMLTCLDRHLRIAFVLGEVFGLTSSEGAWICAISEPAYRKRLSRARSLVRSFVARECGLVAGDAAACHCRKRVDVAVRLGRIDPRVVAEAPAQEIGAAVAEMEALHDAAALIRSVRDHPAPGSVSEAIRALLDSGRVRMVAP